MTEVNTENFQTVDEPMLTPDQADAAIAEALAAKMEEMANEPREEADLPRRPF